MSGHNQAITDDPTKEEIEWADFLQNVPPVQERSVINLWVEGGSSNSMYSSASRKVRTPPLELHCDSEYCGRTLFFDCHNGAYLSRISGGEWIASNFFLEYTCRHCGTREKLYSLRAICSKDTDRYGGRAFKLGELPPYGGPIPARVQRLIQADRELFLQGFRSEKQGLGIGAFAYYRQVVEGQKDRILDKIIKVAERIGAGDDIIQRLDAARGQHQFSNAVEAVKDAIPSQLLINKENPLLLLHKALSDGLHNRNDQECLADATAIRLVLIALADRIEGALKEEAELAEAIRHLKTK